MVNTPSIKKSLSALSIRHYTQQCQRDGSESSGDLAFMYTDPTVLAQQLALDFISVDTEMANE